MTLLEFRDFVEADPDLAILTVNEIESTDPEVVVYGRTVGGGRRMWGVRVSEIRARASEDLIAVLAGRREPDVMRHITRIVGYYSFTKDWNGSKIAELRDRQAGDYGLPETAPAEAAEVAGAA